ncbi:peroxiredoxin [Candidatus Saccharibacteria bacterium]|nr:peroxiredoxin [Candidatus Saccharibacteria bacterium]
MKHIPYKAADFTLYDEQGQVRTLADYAGKWLVLYFYPKDDTPGCTIEACSLRDARNDLANLGAQVVGISKDDAESHETFIRKHSLNFTLLADPSGETIQAYDAWGPKMFGKLGIQRKTFLIDPHGMVQKVYGRVTPLGHGDQVIKDITSLQGSSAAKPHM